MKVYILAVPFAAFIAAPVAAQSFPGARVEVNAGWDRATAKLSYEDTAAPADNFSEDESTDGIIYGATAGYDYQLGNGSYIGIEASFDLADNQRCEPIFGDDALCFDVKRSYAAGARFGTRLGPQSMFYVGAGYANGRATLSYTDDLDPANSVDFTDDQGGYILKGGLEHRLSGNFFAKIEYRYTNYDDYTYSAGTETLKLTLQRHQVVAGLGARF